MYAFLIGHGQLACAFLDESEKNHWNLIQLPKVYYPLKDDRSLRRLFDFCKPVVVINAVAFTDVERAEKDLKLAVEVNSDGVAALAKLAKEYGFLLVHFSTDYVFDGKLDRPWVEHDKPRPINNYGLSKLLGEQAIISSGCSYMILRTSWLHSPWRNNFVKTILSLGRRQEEIKIVSDQIGSPTSASMLAKMTFIAIDNVLSTPSLSGIYHITDSGYVSWFDYARFVIFEAKRQGVLYKEPKIIPITSEMYPSKVNRPSNSILDTTLFCMTFGAQLVDWREGVRYTISHCTFDNI
ncbi:dTDP-4-dehydrorhamnose reductase [Aeromonas jandaei]|uniref:dTDP-4-dehydrorhamnose reductase n=1 Tax=Aeromonas jandaei TaxID=650 RepID=UPI001C0522EE|nr:dTDP-4-dehydrorhamnose reductase [Aeromonas jandaei]QWL65364.1 dTDP-4-dehydrorhamnose reductase [Aeromonas jandaei]